MTRRGITMVLWSYLLLGLPVSASLERVLAPLSREPVPQAADDSTEEENDSSAATPQRLVNASVDELDLLVELERQFAQKLQPAGQLRLIPVSTLPRLPHTTTLPQLELLEYPARLGAATALLRYRLVGEDGRALGTYASSFRVQVLAEVFVPARRMTVGDAIAAADFATREVDLVREPKAVAADSTILARYELARAVAPERVLTWTDLTPRALVRKGHLVEVVAQEGSLSITMRGQATRNGALGDVITVRNLESKREFSAEVVDENKVRVHF
jgi:flagellar basal body P-ring formation protein FlgA